MSKSLLYWNVFKCLNVDEILKSIWIYISDKQSGDWNIKIKLISESLLQWKLLNKQCNKHKNSSNKNPAIKCIHLNLLKLTIFWWIQQHKHKHTSFHNSFFNKTSWLFYFLPSLFMKHVSFNIYFEWFEGEEQNKHKETYKKT